MIEKKQAAEIYNKLQMYEQHGPWWQLTVKEVEYYQWLYSQSQYDKLRQELPSPGKPDNSGEASHD